MMTADNKAAGMPRRLRPSERAYVLMHLSVFFRADASADELLASMPQSDAPVQTDFSIDGIPVLFPMSASCVPYEVDEQGGVVFRHDLLKSAFFLLSGYQEWASPVRDAWGRFPYSESLQSKMGFVGIPVVNHYFGWIVDGIEAHCRLKGIEFRRLSPYQRPVIHLTHDVDLLRYFTFRKALFRCAQVLGLRPCDTSRRRLAQAAGRSLLHSVGLNDDPDVYWSFAKIMDNEAYLGYKSTWFFLPNDGGPFPPDYDLNAEADVQQMMQRLASQGNDVGLHAPIRTVHSEAYRSQLQMIHDVVGQGGAPFGRQHFLAVDAQQSLSQMASAGIEADCSLGFSEHEGFRNSYCFPFRPFDHERQQPMDIVEVPLAVMDTTLFAHRKLSDDEIYETVGQMLDQVRMFGGVFSLLWHNSTFDDTYHPGIFKFYEDLHSLFAQYGMQGLTTSQLLQHPHA